ncbi:hypothetical protein WR25_06063 isoform B [Diploscapter pachys]|uniref:Cysteine--tRNA ligase, cytoplasmic n=1 Tax=Diploscapter pachys TaxID=2018661 RepID=A0A2A2LNM1_9BILA|nr:hypothetical protein WR25_06063 isoform B [Diploscapter pachys]
MSSSNSKRRFDFPLIFETLNLFQIHNALCDSIDTRTVMEKITKLVAIGNAYINEKDKEGVPPNCLILRNIASYITWLLQTFGAIPKQHEIGFPIESSHDATSGIGSSNLETTVMPYLTALAEFRERVREIAKDQKVIKILEECDRLRDEVLPELGVRLEDRTMQTCVKLVDRETLMREAEQKKAAEAQRIAEKEQKARERAEKEAAKNALKNVSPQEMFKTGDEAKKYSNWDGQGIPTHMADGQEVSKGMRKKLEKLWETRRKDFDKTQSNGAAS